MHACPTSGRLGSRTVSQRNIDDLTGPGCDARMTIDRRDHGQRPNTRSGKTDGRPRTERQRQHHLDENCAGAGCPEGRAPETQAKDSRIPDLSGPAGHRSGLQIFGPLRPAFWPNKPHKFGDTGCRCRLVLDKNAMRDVRRLAPCLHRALPATTPRL